MSPAGICFLVASFASFLAERMFDANDAIRWPLHVLAAVLVGIAAASIGAKLRRNPGAARTALAFLALAASSIVFYVLQRKDVVDGLGLTGDSADRYRVVMQCLVALAWIVGTLPMMAIDRTLTASPHSVHPLRFRSAVESGLALAFGIAMLFPMNWLAKEFNVRKDYGFFKTTDVGTSTRAAVDSLDAPVRAILFFSVTSDVLPDVKPYFDDLSGPNFSVEVLDQALAPEQAKEWKVRDNGTIALVKGEGDDEKVELVKLSDKMDVAKKDLRKLDSKVQTALLKLAREKRTAYFTVGHDEMYWKNAANPLESSDTLKKVVEALNFKVKELGMDEGLGNAVPDDAAVVFVTGPKKPFFPEEINALREFRDRGGAIFLMLEPTDTPDPALAELMGVDFDPHPLLSDKQYMRVTNGPADRAFVGSSKFSSHESMTTLTKNASQATLITPTTGSIKERAEHAGKVTVTVKGSPEWWADLDGNYEYDKGTEKRGGWEVAAVASGPAADGKEWRGAVIGDVTWASTAMMQNPAGQYYLTETLGWLTADPALSGETETEEDVKIQHTKEGEAGWFYATTVLVPALVFMGGVFRVSRRRKGGAK
jgi:hypothetical protein